MVDLGFTLLVVVLICIANIVAKRVVKFWRAVHALQLQFPSPPISNWLLGHAVPSMLASEKGFRWMTDTTVKYGRTVLLRLVLSPVRHWLALLPCRSHKFIGL